MTGPLKTSIERDGGLVHMVLARPVANILDGEMIAALRTALETHVSDGNVKAVLISAEGPHFSFGASVEEHLPDNCAAMLESLHGLILAMVEAYVPILVAVRGQCLGGGLELASAGTMIFAENSAQFGQPETKLGVFAPAASCLLPESIGASYAAELLLSGRSLDAEEALRVGLVHVLADDPTESALAYFDHNLAPKSGMALRLAARAARFDLARRLREKLAAVEELYTRDLMSTRDALEGLTAFLEKRPAQWENR